MITYSKLVGRVEVLVSEQFVELITGLDTVALVVVLGSEGLGDIGKVPWLDIVVNSVPSVDVSLDSVAVIADNEAKDDQVSIWYDNSSRCACLHNRVQIILQNSA